jgi:hypothetical protein
MTSMVNTVELLAGPTPPPEAITAVELRWIPLGAGGHFVRCNGKVYEAIAATLARRPRRDIYHAALTIHSCDGDFAVEMTPVPDRGGAHRGVVAEGPVGSRWLGRLRVFRYEVRCWRNGAIPDLRYAIEPPTLLSDDPTTAQRIIDTLPNVPSLVWGRDELHVGEMWTCNSIISWAITRAGLDPTRIALPLDGRAPGWQAGVAIARHENHVRDRPPQADAAPLSYRGMPTPPNASSPDVGLTTSKPDCGRRIGNPPFGGTE